MMSISSALWEYNNIFVFNLYRNLNLLFSLEKNCVWEFMGVLTIIVFPPSTWYDTENLWRIIYGGGVIANIPYYNLII